MSGFLKKSLLILFAVLLPLQGFAAPFMAVSHRLVDGASEQKIVVMDSVAAMPCHEQHAATDGLSSSQDDSKLNCHENSSCCHIAALPLSETTADMLQPDAQSFTPPQIAFLDFLPKQPQRPPRPLPL